MTTLIDTGMASTRHDNIPIAPIIPISLHGKQETLGPTAGHIAHALRIPIEQTDCHLDNLVLNDSEGVKDHGVEGIGVDVLHETFLG